MIEKQTSIMHRDDIHAFKTAFLTLLKDQRDLDFRAAQWARKLRAKYPDGQKGDDKFHAFFELNLKLPEGHTSETWLIKARAGAIVTDAATWNALKQSASQIAKLDRVDRKHHYKVIEIARNDHKTIGYVLREQGLDGLPPVVRVAGNVGGTGRLSQAHRDAETLARFVATYMNDAPKEITDIIEVYAPGVRSRARKNTKRAA